MGRPKKILTENRKSVGRPPRTVNYETVEKENQIVNRKSFLILTDKLWFIDKEKIKVGESMSEIMSGETLTINIKEILVGENFKTWTLIIDKEGKIYLLKTSKKL